MHFEAFFSAMNDNGRASKYALQLIFIAYLPSGGGIEAGDRRGSNGITEVGPPLERVANHIQRQALVGLTAVDLTAVRG